MKKKAIPAALVLLLAVAPVGLPAAVTGPEAAAGATIPGSVIGMGRELGLLVLGIGWEAVRIVLPDSCPAKHEDIDRLIRNDSNPEAATPNSAQPQ